MQIAKRLLSLVLALLMVFALVACTKDPVDTNSGSTSSDTGSDSVQGSDTDGEVTSTSSEEEEFDPGERPYEEMKGKAFVVLQPVPPETPFKYAQDSLMGEKVLDRIEEIETAYGIDMQFVQVTYNDTFGTFMKQMEVTNSPGDLLFVQGNAYLRHAIGTGGKDSLMVDLLSVDHIINFWDMEKWGDISARETAMAGGTFYGVTPALWVDYTPFPYYLLVFNRDILKTFHAIDPQEAWEKKEWDRDVMLESITSVYDTSTGTTVYGLAAASTHMTRATVLTTGCQLVNVDKINADGSVDWHNGLKNTDVVEALQWLKNAYIQNSKYFNDGTWSASGPWNHHNKFLNGEAAYCMTRPAILFSSLVVEAKCDFGLALWAGSEANIMSGYHESIPSVSIPVFASNIEHSAFVMWDLFEGLGDIETMEDMTKYYRDTYFTSDLDITYLFRDGAKISYSYYPHGMDDVWNSFASNLLVAATVQGMVDRFAGTVDHLIETHILPNQVALNTYKEQGYFD